MTEYKQQWKVQGSAAEPYTVSVTFDGVWSCSCVGWTRHMPRKDCKHIKRKKGGRESGEPRASLQEVGNTVGPAAAFPAPSAPTAKSALRAGASREEAADVARVKREEVQAKKDVKLSKMRYGFQLAEEPNLGELIIDRPVALELKYDGHLAMFIDGRIINRSGRDITHRFPEISKVDGPAVILGELIIPDEKGLGDFSGGIQARNTDDESKIRLMSRQRPAMFVAFDILEAAGEDITNLSARQRRTVLESFYRNAKTQRHQLIEQKIVSSKADVKALLERERMRGGEGLMIKSLEAPYIAKRGRNWQKLKTWKEAEFEIVAHGPSGIGDGYTITIRNKDREQIVNLGSYEMRKKVQAGHKRVEIKFLSESVDGALRFPSVRRLVF